MTSETNCWFRFIASWSKAEAITRGATFADNLALCWASAKLFCSSSVIRFSVLQNGIMTQPTFSLAYTSVRADLIASVVDLWRKTASGKHDIEVVISVDANNEKAIAEARKVPNAKVVVQPEAPFNCVRGWNLAAAYTTGKVIIAVADDFKPCVDWDEKMFTLKTGWVDEDWTVHTEDGYVHNLMVLSILTRKRYERFGYLFYPGYESIFCDTEFTEVAYMEGRVINAKHILMEHMHPDCNKRPRDDFDLTHASRDRWNRGEMLFNFRKHRNFPKDVEPTPVKPQATDVSSQFSKFAVYMQATRDDLCLREVVGRLFDEGIRNFFFCIPDEYWSGKPTPQSDIQQVLDAAEWLRSLGAKAMTKIFCVADFRFPGDSRIVVETRVRNDSLAWVRQNGFTNICVVDSDELWPKGSLAVIKELVEKSNPLAISLPMIPVVGFPGYPIQGATDRVISYVGQSCVFRDCRTPIGQVYYENRVMVYHFTSTRRTMEETIEKHRQSGHFDDPEYDFEGWLKNVLPNIKPGMKNAHMFKRYQIWPEVRAWKPEELSDIPQTIHQYLAING